MTVKQNNNKNVTNIHSHGLYLFSFYTTRDDYKGEISFADCVVWFSS